MKPFLALLCLVFLMSTGCKAQKDLFLNKEIKGVGGINANGVRNFTPAELKIARRICTNLKVKRDFFESLDNEKEQFRFRGEVGSCEGLITNSELFVASISNANSTDLEYIASRANYLKDIITDQSGVLKDICEAVIQNQVVSNTLFSGNFGYSINFLIADGYDRYEITKAKKNSLGSYDTLSSEGISFFSQNVQGLSKFYGVEKERIRYTACDSLHNSTVKQTWVEAITRF